MRDIPKEFKGEWRSCKRCLTQYKLGVPYSEANSPARDLCDNCIVDLSQEEFMAYTLEEGPALVPEKIVSTGNKGEGLSDFF